MMGEADVNVELLRMNSENAENDKLERGNNGITTDRCTQCNAQVYNKYDTNKTESVSDKNRTSISCKSKSCAKSEELVYKNSQGVRPQHPHSKDKMRHKQSASADIETVFQNGVFETKVVFPDESYNKNTKGASRSRCCSGVIAVTCAVITSIVCFTIFSSKPIKQLVTNQDADIPQMDSSYASHFHGSLQENAYAQFYLNQKALNDEKIISWIPEQQVETIHVDDNGCIAVSTPGLYIVISKVTFEIKNDTEIQPFHSIILKNQNNDRELLEKNVFSLLKREYRQYRTLLPSTITLSRMLKADDSLCVAVNDPAVKWIHVSPTDNTFNIFKL